MKKKVLFLLLGLVFVVSSCFIVNAKKAVKIAMIIAPQKFAEQEYNEPRAIFEQNGAKITVASTTMAPATCYGDQKVNPDVKIDELKANNFDAIVIIGGEGAVTYLWDNQALKTLVIDSFKNKKLVAAICAAPVVLARAGILTGRDATCYPDQGFIKELKASGANYIDQSVVVSDNIITGNGPSSSTPFGKKVWEELNH